MADESNSEMSTDLRFDDIAKNSINASPVIYGPYEKLVLNDWEQCGLHHGVLQAFDKMNIKEMTPIQKHCFSYLMSYFNTVIVGSSKGKTISHLAHIISSMVFDDDSDKLKNLDIGPYTIILTDSLESCSELECLLKTMLSALFKEISVFVVDPLNSMCYLEAYFIHGCKILISTPSNLIILLNKTTYFSWLNLKYFVFENIDILLGCYEDEMSTILIKSREPNNCSSDTQMISTSVRWTMRMEQFFKKFFIQWQYIFGCHLEAAHYMNMAFYIVHLRKNKLKMISWYLTNNFTQGRFVLITSNTDELSVIHNYIQEYNSDIDVLLADKNKSELTLINWNTPLEKSKRLLICSDDIMFDYNIDNADYLIHYDVPVKKCRFEERFSFLLDSNNKPKKRKISSYAFLSEDPADLLIMPKVVEIMKYFGEIDPIIQQAAGIQIINQEKEKKTLLCDKLLQFGKCPEQLSCKNRHIVIKELDKSADFIPMTGVAEIEILNVYDASHMSAKLLNINCSNSLTDMNDLSEVEDNSDTIKHELSLFYSDPESRVSLENLKSGDKVAVELETNTDEVINSEYFRAMVIDIIDENTMNSTVKVKLIDRGLIEIVSKWKVFSLPHHLEKLKTITVDVYLLSVKPAFSDKVWHSKANLDAKEKIIIGHRVIVDIRFSLRNTVWITKLYSKCISPTSSKFDIKTILPDMLFQGNYGTENLLHYNKLFALIIAAGIDVFEPKEIKKDCEANIEKITPKFNHLIEWEHLDETLTLVDIDNFISLGCFFLRKADSAEGLHGLQQYITDSIALRKLEPLKDIVKGEIGLAYRKETNQYCRMMISKVLNDTSVEILFVDYGEFSRIDSKLLLSTLPYLISLLPFQAIECSLCGISDVLPSGLDLVNSKFRLTRGPVHVQVIEVESPIFTGGRHYKVDVYHKDSNVNAMLKEMYQEIIETSNDVVNDDTSQM